MNSRGTAERDQKISYVTAIHASCHVHLSVEAWLNFLRLNSIFQNSRCSDEFSFKVRRERKREWLWTVVTNSAEIPDSQSLKINVHKAGSRL